MKNRILKSTKGFTLIELLAVIIILGILMIIAIPSVTTYISNSRKSSYIDTAKNIIGAARTLINSGKYETYDRDVTYYVPVSCISSENGAQTPYGEFSKAYVVVTYDGDGYDYYFTGNDTSKTGIKKIIGYDDLVPEHIETEVEDTDIVIDVGIGGRNKVRIMKESCDGWDEAINAGNMLNDDGTVSERVNFMESRFRNGFDLGNDRDYWAYRTSIRSFTFQTTMNPPSNYVYKFDVSANKDESIIAYLVNNSDWGYDVYIQSNGYIYANPDCSYYFAYMENLEHFHNIENFKVDYVTNMSYMFAFVGNFETFDVSSWNTSRVTDMSHMFTSIDDFFFMGGRDLDLSSFDTSSVTDMSYMFYGLYYVHGINLNGFDTSNVTNMEQMFGHEYYLEQVDIRSFDTSNVTDMDGMFWADYNLSKILVGNKWNTSNVTTSIGMFEYDRSLPNFNQNVIDKTNANTSATGYLSTQ